MFSGIKVRDYMSSPVTVIHSYDTLGYIKNLMLERRFHHFPVIGECEELLGIVSISDVLRAMSKGGTPWRWRSWESRLVDRVMTPNPITVGTDDLLIEAAAKMTTRRISSLPVVSDNRLVGILTKTDILRAVVDEIKGIVKVRNCMKRPVVLREGTPLKKAARLLYAGKEEVLLVRLPNSLGILSESNIIFFGLEASGKYEVLDARSGRISIDVKQGRVSELVHEVDVFLSPEMDISNAGRLLLEWNVPGLPVVENKKLVGVLTKRGVVRGVHLAGRRSS